MVKKFGKVWKKARKKFGNFGKISEISVTGFSECLVISVISEIWKFRTFQKLRKNDVLFELWKFENIYSDSKTDPKVRLKVRNAGPYVTWHFDNDIAEKPDVLHTLWTLTTIYAKSEEELQKQMEWEHHLTNEFTKEIDRAARRNKKRNYKNATIQAFMRMGISVNPQWLNGINITGDTIHNHDNVENIWYDIQAYLQREQRVRIENRSGKEHWLQMLNKAISYNEQIAQKQCKPTDYTNALLYSLSQAVRRVNPDILKDMPTRHLESLTQKETLEQIWELACLELDHKKLESKEQTNNPQKKGQKVNQRTCWTKKLRKYLYANLENIRKKGIWLTNSKVIVEAFSEIGWSFKTRQFQEFNEIDPYALLYSNNQKEVWQKACSLREKPKKPKALPEPPVEVLRREWQKALVDIANDHKQKRKNSAKHNPIDYKKVVITAFKRIAWNVPKHTVS